LPAYYNEFDPFAAEWLKKLIDKNLIAKGDVDVRSITEVQPDDLKGYTQCHFFAGIGGWSYALRLAGWDDKRPVWTGSCPCQSFSSAGKQKGKDDARHLWPVWSRLIRECRPATVFGEQVANAITHEWLDEVATDLETENYAFGSAVLPACSVGAPHRRDRLWFVAANNRSKRGEGFQQEEIQIQQGFSWCENVRGVEDLRNRPDLYPPTLCSTRDGVLNLVEQLRGYGNAIVPQVAAEFIRASEGFVT
jgi:DNA (cytosine-5)-methyltransferase 1